MEPRDRFEIIGAPPRSIILGRDEFIDEAMATLTGRPCPHGILIHGSAGCGKTQIALEIGRRYPREDIKRRIYIDLRGFAVGQTELSATDIIRNALISSGFLASDIPAIWSDLISLWSRKVSRERFLLIIDNVTSRGQIEEIMTYGSLLTIIATSRRLIDFHYQIAHLRVPDLGTTASAEIARSLLSGSEVTTDEIARISALARGNAFLLTRITARVVRRNHMSITENLDELESYCPSIGNELGMHQLLDATLSALDSVTAEIYEMLTVGNIANVTYRAMEAATGRHLSECRRCLLILEDYHLVEPVNSATYALHDLVREHSKSRLVHKLARSDRCRAAVAIGKELCASLDGFASTGRPDLHSRNSSVCLDDLLNVIESILAENSKEGLVSLIDVACRHAVKLGQSERILHIVAAVWRMTRVDCNFSDKLRVADSFALVAWETGMFETAVDVCREIFSDAGELSDSDAESYISLRLKLAFTYERIGQYPNGLREIDIAVEMCRSAEQLSSCHRIRGALQWRQAMYQDALRSFWRARQVARGCAALGLMPNILNNIGFTYHKLGNQSLAKRFLEAAAGLSMEQGNRSCYLTAIVNYGFCQIAEGAADTACETARYARSVAGESNRYEYARALWVEGRAMRALGNPEWTGIMGEALTLFELQRAVERSEVRREIEKIGGVQIC